MADQFVAAIHLGCGPDAVADMRAAATENGAMVIPVDVSQVTDRASLLSVLGRDFQFPAETGLDGAADYLSDPWWYGNEDGYLVVVTGLAELLDAAPDTFEQFVDMLPSVVDRCRTAGLPYRVVLVGDGAVADRAAEVVSVANESLAESARSYPGLHDVQAVPVIDHRSQ